ncbi:Adenosine receptor A2a [Acropora cervicornis]|uniref:Adenosine receptor A2a n=1 Tax=Acropora cervicornis TaxID=6130 RepID=A0AAD9QP79_ACRCE|nr:Adenosine receptor A2a [Acropora cervicornis]
MPDGTSEKELIDSASFSKLNPNVNSELKTGESRPEIKLTLTISAPISFHIEMPDTLFWIFVSVVIIEATLICLGNAFTIFVFWRQRASLKKAYHLLVNLAIADLLVGASTLVRVAGKKILKRQPLIIGDLFSVFFCLFTTLSVLCLMTAGKMPSIKIRCNTCICEFPTQRSLKKHAEKKDHQLNFCGTKENYKQCAKWVGAIFPLIQFEMMTQYMLPKRLQSEMMKHTEFMVCIPQRAYAVLWPFRHRVARTRIYISGIALPWIGGLSSAILDFFLINGSVSFKSALSTIISLLFASLIVTLAAYMKVRKRLNSPHPLLEGQNRETVEQNVKLSKTLFVVIGLSFSFWLPTIILYTILAFCLNCANLYLLWLVTILSLANSVVNPFVYCYKMPAFKAAMKRLFLKNTGE